MRKKTGTYVV